MSRLGRRIRGLGCAGCFVAVLSLVVGHGVSAKTTKKPDEPADPVAPTVLQLPALLDLTLKVDALLELYDLDASPDQVKAMRTAAAGTADAKQRPVARGTAKLNELTRVLHEALLAGADADRIREVRQQMEDEEDEDGVEIEHSVRSSDASRMMAGAVIQKFKASQVAAYLAEHAEEVSDPVELMTDTLAAARSGESSDDDTHQACERFGALVGGADAAKVKEATQQAIAWVASGRALKDDAYAQQTASLEESAHKIVGQLSPVQVLGNWMEYRAAILMANPQFIPAADEWIEARSKKPIQ